MLFEELITGKKSIAVIGLGYVGLPLAIELSRYFKVIGYDINYNKIRSLKSGIFPNADFQYDQKDLQNIQFSNERECLNGASFFIVAVPTEINQHKVPILTPLLKASEDIGKVIKRGDCVVFESTTYPGCTEEDCSPLIEQESGLVAGKDFVLGYSPERISPGEKSRSLRTIQKIISANTTEGLDLIDHVYSKIVDAGLFRASSIRVAEAAKVIENTQRDLNISLMNELAMLFDKLGLDIYEVLAAARSKWNFLPFSPGLVGGHCISVDPHYLLHKARQVGYEPEVILSGRRVNDQMPLFIGRKVAQNLTLLGKNLSKSQVLVLGVTFKENVSDIRNSRVFDLISELGNFSMNITVSDPFADSLEVKQRFGISMTKMHIVQYDAIIIAVGHQQYRDLDISFFEKHGTRDVLIFDIKALYDPLLFEGKKLYRL